MLSHELYSIFKNVEEMLINCRGYKPSHLYDISYDEFKHLSRQQLTIKTEIREDSKYNNNPILIFFPDDLGYGIKTLRNCKLLMISNKVKHAILIIKNTVTSSVKNTINDEYKNEGFIIEIFNENDFLIDITKHELVPKHELLTNEEKEEFLKNYKLNELPTILIHDPIVRRFGANIRDIFKITRLSETSGITYYYRVVRNV